MDFGNGVMKKCFLAALSTVMAVSTAIPVSAQETEEPYDRIEETISGMSLWEKAGQMIMADFRTWNEDPEGENSQAVPVTELNEEIRNAIEDDCLGGVILFAENCGGNEQTLKLVNQMQQANLEGKSGQKIPLLIAADQEGGGVSRLGEGTRWIGNMALAATADTRNARKAAQVIGQELSALGINVDFAPVLDVNSNPENPVIGVRSFSDDPEITARYGISYLEGLKENGTISALKHFPGHGDVATDSHTGFPVLEKTYEELKTCELIPFQAAIDAGADMVMTAHIQYPKIETDTYTSVSTGEEVYLPATLSDTILQGMLRQDMGFEGVIVSDAMNMAAISDNFDRKDVCRMALEAGIDLFLMPVPVTDTASAQELGDFISHICQLVENGSIPESRIDESVRRILKLKEEHGILDLTFGDLTQEQLDAARDTVGSQENHALEWEIMQQSATLLKDEQGLLPLHPEAGEKVLVLYTAASRIATGEAARKRLVEEGLIGEDVLFENLALGDKSLEEILEKAENADYVIVVSTVFSPAALNPGVEDGANSAVLDQVIQAVHEAGKPVILVSSYLPYDVARYQEADVLVLTYGSTPMAALPEGKQAWSANIPATICGIFGEFEFTGKLPVNIPRLGENYSFTEEILYSREIE